MFTAPLSNGARSVHEKVDMTAPTRAPARARARLRPFIGADGEAVNVKIGRGRNARVDHRYVVLRIGEDELVDRDGIATKDALDFILRCANTRVGIMVGFAFNYDVNMILRDVPIDTLRELWTNSEVDVELDGMTYSIEWLPSKMFSVAINHPLTGARITAKIWDTWGYFQSSFVKALQDWRIDDPDGQIARMKDQRADFTLSNLRAIRDYNAAECVLLANLMENVRAALHEADLHPRTWLGAGSIATALMGRHNVDEHVAPPRSPHFEEDVLMRAYFGGRTEVFRQGMIGEATAFDINSAYPTAAVGLPSGQGEWKRVRTYDPRIEFAIWRVSWDLPEETLVAPFPFRVKRAIYYPLRGEGYYHAIEVAAARAVYGDAIRIRGGYAYLPRSSERPFEFIPEVYAQRRAYKAEGRAAEKVLKLGLNSLYGKLAQGSGRNGLRPRFQDYFWSGYITAHCRASVLRAIAQAPDAIVAVATDGVMFAGHPDLDVPIGDTLGTWDETRYSELFVAQPGMFCAKSNRKVVRRSRGFFTREINYPALQRAWLRDGADGYLTCRSTRFVGLGTALMRSDFDVWRTWQEGTRMLSLRSSRKHYDDDDYRSTLRTLHPPYEAAPGLSAPYVPKHALVELDEDEDFVQGQEQPLVE